MAVWMRSRSRRWRYSLRMSASLAPRISSFCSALSTTLSRRAAAAT
ncbi:Uncharacterised protein [Bordetella pertussis]|nr:Uncharacterised protein [Bordetella pertussis]